MFKNGESNKQLAKNIVYNMLSQSFVLLASLLTAPYVARVFNADLIGDYSYTLANSTYFVLIESLGFALYGQIQVAANRDNKKKVNLLFWEIMIFKVVLMGITALLYLAVSHPDYTTIRGKLCFVLVINVIAEGINPIWFLNGLELFKTVAVRSIFIRLICTSAIFIFVHSQSDIFLYAIIMQGTNLIANIVVYPSLLPFIGKPNLKEMHPLQHFKPAMIYFIPGLVNTIFGSTDRTMIGVYSTSSEVGVYEQANKIVQICLSTISAIGNVVLPRAAYLYGKKKDSLEDEAGKLLTNSIKIVAFVAAPVVFGIIAISDEFVPIFFGPGYERSIILTNILAINVFFTVISNICGQQCLIARQQQKKYNISILSAALLNVFLNYVLINNYRSIGAAIASLISGVFSFSVILFYSQKIYKLSRLVSDIWIYILMAGIMGCVILVIKKNTYFTVAGMIVHIVVGAIIYVGLLLLVKEKAILGIKDNILEKNKSGK